MKPIKAMILIIFLGLWAILLSSDLNSVDSRSGSGMTDDRPLRIVSQNRNQIKLRLDGKGLRAEGREPGASTFQTLEVAGFRQTAETGMPQLPFMSTTLAIPLVGDYDVRVSYGKQSTIPNILPKPVFADEESERSLVYNRAYYSSQSQYPGKLFDQSPAQILRDFRIVTIDLYPYQWNPATLELKYYESMEVEVVFDQTAVVPFSYSKTFEKLYSSIIDNFEFYRNDDPPQNPRVLLIHGSSTDQNFLSKLNEFVNWKRQKGLDVFPVSTAITGTSNTAIKTYIQNRYDNLATRPDFIILLGDVNGSYPIPSWQENISSYNGEGDYPYTHLAGGDYLGDAFIGRISASNYNELEVLFNKIYTYEKNININGTNAAWLNRILLIGDHSSSGISTIYTNKYIKEIAQQTNPNYSFLETYNGGYSNAINTGINQGVAFFNYRGYIGMSGWSPSSSLINGAKLPHAVILTCGTGSYNGTSTTEAFIRLGTAADPKGALTAIGMATSGTHTLFNNALNGGIFDGIFRSKMRTMGEALLNGRLYLNTVYGVSNPSPTQYFAHWCNLMGDPTVDVFVGIPQTLTVEAPVTIPSGTPIIDVTVTDSQGSPIRYASVTVFQSTTNSILATGFTNDEGWITLQIPSYAYGSLLITAAKNDYKPTQVTTTVDPDGSLVFNQQMITDDGSSGSSGNGNGYINASERIAMSIQVKNTTANAMTGLSGVLTTNDPRITIIQQNSSFPDATPSEIVSSGSMFLFDIDHSISPVHDIRFNLVVTDASSTNYDCVFHVPAYNALLDVFQVNVNSGGNNVLDPSETGSVTVSIKNNGAYLVENVQAELASLNDLILVVDNQADYGNIPGGMVVNSTDAFSVFARPQLVAGMQIPMRIRLFNASGFEQFCSFNLQIGQVTVNAPLGPDPYGYMIYGMEDTAYPDCPTYQWVEIHPSLGGAGTLIPLNDSGTSGNEGDQVGSTALAVVNLPFSFRFYGIDYNQITVCVNGFIAMGVTENGDFRNYRLPGPMGASPMIAAFWDDLIIISDGGVYKYYDASNHTFIIQYHKMRNGFNRTSEETFQVIFYDPLYYPTGLEDGMIKIQYKVFNNVDAGTTGYTPWHGNFCTIGIKDHTGLRGLEYTYNNHYPTAAGQLYNLKSLLITTVPVLHQNPYLVVSETIINDDNENGIPESGETIEVGIKLTNLGLETATSVQLQASVVSPYITVLNNSTSYQDISGSSAAVNQTPILLQISEDCPDNVTVQLVCNVTIAGNSWQYPVSITIRKPTIRIASLLINDILGNGNGIIEPGETFKLVVNYENTSIADARNVTSNIFCPDARVTIYNPQQILNDIPAGTQVQAVYEVSFDQTVSLGTFVTFYLTFLGDLIPAQNQSVAVSCGITGMSHDFEESNGGFLAAPSTNGWEWGTSSYAGAYSGVKVWGTRLNQEYPNNVSYSLTSPAVYIGENYGLEFWHKYDMEQGYDGGNVKISTNNGATWSLLTPEGGYNMTAVPALTEPGWSGNMNNWTLARFNLATYANQTVKFKWTFASDGMITGQGWFIDNVSTTGFIDFGGMVSGEVLTSNPNTDYSKILVKAGNNMAVHPNEQGVYDLYLPSGGHFLTASGLGYQSEASTGFYVSIANPVITRDFYLIWWNSPSELDFSINQDQLQLTWQEPVQPMHILTGYQIFKRFNAGAFEMIHETTQPFYNEAIADSGDYHYYVVAIYEQGDSAPSNAISFHFPYVDNEDDSQTPLVTKLYACYPNPFNPSTTIKFSLRESGKTQLKVYNLRGQLVKTLSSAVLPAGMHQIQWNGKDDTERSVASGIYFYRLETKELVQTKKMILAK